MTVFYRDVYVPLVKAVLARDGYRCRIQARGCRGRATAAHELLTRGRGGGIRAEGVATEENMVAACNPCNRWASMNPTEALEAGWLRRSNHV